LRAFYAEWPNNIRYRRSSLFRVWTCPASRPELVPRNGEVDTSIISNTTQIQAVQLYNTVKVPPPSCLNTSQLIKSYSTTRDRTLPPPVRRLGSRSHRSPAPAAAALRCATCHLRGRRRLSSSACCTLRMPPGWPHPRFWPAKQMMRQDMKIDIDRQGKEYTLMTHRQVKPF